MHFSYSYAQKADFSQYKKTTDVYALLKKAQTAMSNNDIEQTTSLLNQVAQESPHNSPYYAEANINLATIYYNKGNLVEMGQVIKALDKYTVNPNDSDIMKRIEDVKYLYTVLVKDKTLFEDDLCGIWVSDYCSDQQKGIPYLVLQVEKDAWGEYTAKILPYCTLAKEHKMYTGRAFKQKPRMQAALPNSTNKNNYLSITKNCYINIGKDGMASFHFGSENFKKGNPQAATAGVVAVGEIGATAKTIILSDPNKKSSDAATQALAVDAAQLAAQYLIAKSAISKITVVTLDMDISSVFAGCAELAFKQNIYTEASDGSKSSSSASKEMMIFKLYSDYNVLFTADGGELFGYRSFEKNELSATTEYKKEVHIAKKSMIDYNKQAYQNLSAQVVKLCEYSSTDTLLPINIQRHFKYSTQGLSYVEDYKGFDKINYVYTGWLNTNNKAEGYGERSMSWGERYIGEWKNGKYHGDGELIDKNGIRYEGEFRSGKKCGQGVCVFYDYSAGMLYSSRNVFTGEWAGNSPYRGTIQYPKDSSYTGNVWFNKKTKQIEKLPQNTSTHNNPLGFSVGYVQKQWIQKSGKKTHKWGAWNDENSTLKGIQTGLRYEPQFKYGLGLSTGLYWEYYRSKSGEIYNNDRIYNEHSLYLPLHFKYNWNLSRNFSLFAETGPSFDYGLTTSISIFEKGENEPSFQINEIYENPDLGYPHKRFNASFDFGAGLRWGPMQLNVGTGLGLLNISSAPGIKVRQNKPLTASLSYMIPSEVTNDFKYGNGTYNNFGLSYGYISKQWEWSFNNQTAQKYALWEQNATIHGFRFLGFAWQPTFAYGFGMLTGLNIDMYLASLDYNDVSANYFEYSLNVPVHAEYRWAFSEKFSLFFEIGPSFDLGVDNSLSFDQSSQIEEQDNIYENVDWGYPTGRFVPYLDFGGGIRYWNVQLSCLSGRGLTQTTLENGIKVRQNRPLNIYFTLFFGI